MLFFRLPILIENFHHKKSLGQHFLKDKNIAIKIVKTAQIEKNDIVLEIGPGKGILTDEILKYTKNVLCFEVDKSLYPYLKGKYGSSITLIENDVLKADWEKFLSKEKNYKIVSNLPYQITSPFLFKLIQFKDFFSKIVIMIQKEVAERLNAKPNSKKYGVLSLKIGFYFNVKYEFGVKPHLFYPPPKVDSAVISLTPKKRDINFKNIELFWQIVEVLFKSRRKTIKNNLKKILQADEISVLEMETEISFSKRAENLDFYDFYKIYSVIEKNKWIGNRQ